MAMVKDEITTHNGLAQKRLFNDPEFAARYKIGEPITGAFGLDLLTQLGLHSQKEPVHFLDLACGTGIISKYAINILNEARSATILSDKDHFTCSDLAPLMLDVLRSRIEVESWPVNARQIEIKQGDMRDPKLPANTYTHVACNFGPVMAPNPERVLQESFRVLKPGGVAGWTAWCKIGWQPHMKQALRDIRSTAARKCEDGTASEDDRKLSKLPDMLPADEVIGRFAGIDIRQLRAQHVAEGDIPRWDSKQFFESQVLKAGFEDVKVVPAQKTFHVDYYSASQMTKPVVGILTTFWSQAERDELTGVDLEGKLQEWWSGRFMGSDVRDGKLAWDQSEALVVSGRKPL